MKMISHVKAGGTYYNHNETLVRDNRKGLKIKTALRAGTPSIPIPPPSGKLAVNHNETLVRDNGKNLKVKTALRAGKKAN